MKEHLRQLAEGGPARAGNLVREYLQARILASLQRRGAMVHLAFHGGTALRFLHSIRRFSEDLDFTLERLDGFDYRGLLRGLEGEMGREGYALEIRVRDDRPVHSAFVRFPGLPFDLGLSAHRTATLAIKLEVDTRPPRGVGLETTVVRRHLTLRLHHHDRASLLAGKLHAVLQRPFTKGRDLYDLLWYLSDRAWPGPNLTLLNNALRQTGWSGGELGPDSWRDAVRLRLDAVDWPRAVADVRPFLESEADLDMLNREDLLRVLQDSGKA